MKTRFTIILGILLLTVTSCGIQKTVTSGTGKTSSATKSKDLVQTTFFGATFGDEGQYAVKQTMSKNGIGHNWEPVIKNQWGIDNVEFAGRVWYATVIFFVDNKFSQILFTEKADNKEMGQNVFTELYELLSQKYPIRKNSTTEMGEDYYYFYDSQNNMVGLNLMFSEDVGAWMINLFYGWGKAIDIKENKALNEI